MALAKYSPTVDAAYRHDQDWFDKYSKNNQYDPQGYDEYGYDKDDRDRHGYYEYDYCGKCKLCGASNCDLYMNVRDKWEFDGVKPVRVTA